MEDFKSSFNRISTLYREIEPVAVKAYSCWTACWENKGLNAEALEAVSACTARGHDGLYVLAAVTLRELHHNMLDAMGLERFPQHGQLILGVAKCKETSDDLVNRVAVMACVYDLNDMVSCLRVSSQLVGMARNEPDTLITWLKVALDLGAAYRAGEMTAVLDPMDPPRD